MNPDIKVTNHGTVFLFDPRTDAGAEWIAANVSDDALWFGGSLAVEPRYARDLAQGMLDAGLDVE